MSDSRHFRVEELPDYEFLQIQARRAKALAKRECNPHQPGSPDYVALEEAGKAVARPERDLIGVAFSGGGIRSATFGLGVLQGLADLRLLKFCDYISTVSGGGYIGSWLAAWIKREGSVDNVEKQLRPDRTDQDDAQRGFPQARPQQIRAGTACEPEPEPIDHLRQYSNYLSPRVRLTSADGWSLIAIYLRNLLANLLALLPALLALFLVVRSLAATCAWSSPGWVRPLWHGCHVIAAYGPFPGNVGLDPGQ